MFMRTDTGKFFTRILMHTQNEILTIHWRGFVLLAGCLATVLRRLPPPTTLTVSHKQ